MFPVIFAFSAAYAVTDWIERAVYGQSAASTLKKGYEAYSNPRGNGSTTPSSTSSSVGMNGTFTTTSPARPVVTNVQPGLFSRARAYLFGSGSAATSTSTAPGWATLIQMALILGFFVVGFATLREVLQTIKK